MSSKASKFIKKSPDTGGIYIIDLGDGVILPNVDLATCYVAEPNITKTFREDGWYLKEKIKIFPKKERISFSQIGDNQYAARYDLVFWGIRGSNFPLFFETRAECLAYKINNKLEGSITPYFCVNPSHPLFYKDVFEHCIRACETQISNAEEVDSRSERNGYIAGIRDCIDAIKSAQNPTEQEALEGGAA